MDVLHIYRAAALVATIGSHQALQSDSLFAQTRATITATAVVAASTTSLRSLAHATLLVNRAVQQPESLTTPVSFRDETGHSTITVLVTTPTNSTTSPDRGSRHDWPDPGDAPTVATIVPPDGARRALLVTIAYTAN